MSINDILQQYKKSNQGTNKHTCVCGKEYANRSGLYYHKKLCEKHVVNRENKITDTAKTVKTLNTSDKAKIVRTLNTMLQSIEQLRIQIENL